MSGREHLQQKPKLGASPLADLSVMVLRSATDFGTVIVEKTEKWSKVIKSANVRPER
jgi:hypothetical protein